jgi:hypothetical protein
MDRRLQGSGHASPLDAAILEFQALHFQGIQESWTSGQEA